MRHIYTNIMIGLITVSFIYSPMAFARPTKTRVNVGARGNNLLKVIKKNRKGLNVSQVIEASKPMFRKRAYRDILKNTVPYWDTKISQVLIGKDYFKLTIKGETLFARYVDRGQVAFVVNNKPLLWKDFLTYGRAKARLAEILTGKKQKFKKVSFLDKVLESFGMIGSAWAVERKDQQCYDINGKKFGKGPCFENEDKLKRSPKALNLWTRIENAGLGGGVLFCCSPTPNYKNGSCVGPNGKKDKPKNKQELNKWKEATKAKLRKPTSAKINRICHHGKNAQGVCNPDPNLVQSHAGHIVKGCGPNNQPKCDPKKGKIINIKGQSHCVPKNCVHGKNAQGFCNPDPQAGGSAVGCDKPGAVDGTCAPVNQAVEDECPPGARDENGDCGEGQAIPPKKGFNWKLLLMIGLPILLLFFLLKKKKKNNSSSATGTPSVVLPPNPGYTPDPNSELQCGIGRGQRITSAADLPATCPCHTTGTCTGTGYDGGSIDGNGGLYPTR